MPEVITSLSSEQQLWDSFVARNFRDCLVGSTILLGRAVDLSDSSDIEEAGEAYDKTLKKFTDTFWEKPAGVPSNSVLWLGHAHSMAKVIESGYTRPGGYYTTGEYRDIARSSFGTALSLVKKDGLLTIESRAKFGLVLADGMNTVNSDKRQREEAKTAMDSLHPRIDPNATSSWVISELSQTHDWEDQASRLAGLAMLELMSDYTRRNQVPQPEAESPRLLRAALSGMAGLLPEFARI